MPVFEDEEAEPEEPWYAPRADPPAPPPELEEPPARPLFADEPRVPRYDTPPPPSQPEQEDHWPFQTAMPAVEIAVSRHQQIVALEDEVADLADRFETRKLVDRAKSKLQTQFGMTEPEAFRWIQKTSMDKRLTMREVATTVISAGEDRG